MPHTISTLSYTHINAFSTEFTSLVHQLLLTSRQVCRRAGFPTPPALLSVGLSPHLGSVNSTCWSLSWSQKELRVTLQGRACSIPWLPHWDISTSGSHSPMRPKYHHHDGNIKGDWFHCLIQPSISSTPLSPHAASLQSGLRGSHLGVPSEGPFPLAGISHPIPHPHRGTAAHAVTHDTTQCTANNTLLCAYWPKQRRWALLCQPIWAGRAPAPEGAGSSTRCSCPSGNHWELLYNCSVCVKCISYKDSLKLLKKMPRKQGLAGKGRENSTAEALRSQPGVSLCMKMYS